MKVNFKDIIEKIKETNIDQEETMEYILEIKKILDKLTKDCENKEERQEVLQQFIEEYQEDMTFRGDAEGIFNGILKYNTYKKILKDCKSNKAMFDSVMREARKRENGSNKEDIRMSVDTKEAMISAIRYILRTKGITKERDILEFITKEKSKLNKNLKDNMIKIIHFSISSLEEYGIIDEYIKYSNEGLEGLGLSELKLIKRNPIADEEYNINGDIIKDKEDIGVLDVFSSDSLKGMSIADLEFITAFWESKYFQHRIGISKAKAVIDTLGLWDTILNEDEETIKDIDKGRIESALKKDIAVTYLCRDDYEITSKIDRQYNKFLEKEGISSDLKLEDEVKKINPELINLSEMARDISILEGLIIYQLDKKELKVKKWGIIPEEETSKDAKGVLIAIENKNFRGPLLMEVPEEVLSRFLGNEQAEFPKYDKYIDETYSSIMAMLYMPSNNFFRRMIREAYKKSPESKLIADLNGKEVR